MEENARLNGGKFLAVIDGWRCFPGLAQILAALKMHLPSVVLATAGAQQFAIRQLHRFVLDRTKDSLRQSFWNRPGETAVVGGHPHAPPFAWIRADLEEEQQRSRLRLEEHRIPTGETRAFRLFAIG